MNIKRALGFSVLLYLSTFVVFGVFSLIPGLTLVEGNQMTFNAYIANWIIMIPVILIFAKWYFRKAEVSLKNGVYLGLFALAVAFAFDGLSYVLTLYLGESTEMFEVMYSNWKFYVSVAEVVLVTAYAGSEFDATFTNINKNQAIKPIKTTQPKHIKKAKKKSKKK